MSIISSTLGSTYTMTRNTIGQSGVHSEAQTSKAQAKSEVSPIDKRISQTTTSKPFSEVASYARSMLNAHYKKLDVNPINYRDNTGAFRRDAFDALDFDRRTLFAIASNEGNQFSEEEMKAAKSVMNDQLQKAKYGDIPGQKSHLQAARDAINFYENAASPEEKASFEWAKERATVQVQHKSFLEDEGKTEDLKSDNPIVKLLFSAFDELFEVHNRGDMDAKLEDMPAYSRAFDQWKEESTNFGEYSFNFVV